MCHMYFFLAAILAVHGAAAEECQVRAQTTAGAVCGVVRGGGGPHPHPYAAFYGVPYAKQPVGALRFKELQPPEKWAGARDASRPGPVCPQTDVFYGRLMRPTAMSEECIHANVYVSCGALPKYNEGLKIKELGLPILVMVHGGGFAFGSGDDDLYSPEYLLRSAPMVVITFNYRLNVFGFLSLNSPQVPGNNGLRDVITLLNWVKDNAEYFGGNPDDVTLAGQSAGAAAVHLLTLTPAAQGLFNRAFIMSGTAIGTFYTLSPAYAQYVSKMFLGSLGINSTDPEEIHTLLTEVPLDRIMNSNKNLLELFGLGVFYPVIESRQPGVKTIIPEDTESLLAKGYGRDIPLLIGFTNKECEIFRKRFTDIDVLSRIKHNPLTMSPLSVTFSVPQELALQKAGAISHRYFNGAPTIEKFVNYCTDLYFQYPALKLAGYRSEFGGAPTYLYQFSYNSHKNPIKIGLGQNFEGAGHIEDMSYIFNSNAVPVERDHMDNLMVELMTRYLVNFMSNDRPSRLAFWQPVEENVVSYQNIGSAFRLAPSNVTKDQDDMVRFFDGILKNRS